MSYKLKNKGALSEHETAIISYLESNMVASSSQIFVAFGQQASYATVKRVLQAMVAKELIAVSGQGRGTRYTISNKYNLLTPLDIDAYFKTEVDERKIREGFNFQLSGDLQRYGSLFTVMESRMLHDLQGKFIEHTSVLTTAQFKSEFERLAIDLSWKSSQIEGNTYSLLETELLLKENQEATGKTKAEATMLLNHKAALDFILEHPDYSYPLNVSRIEDLHSMLIRDLPIGRNIRQRRVGISGTNYRPLDNEYQIREALEDMCSLINVREDVFEKALLALLFISYIQPFEDGNKRTARILSNALLINHSYCPISFRTVDAMDYKKAMLIFYEQNNISACKQIFIAQFEFAVDKYF